MARCCYPILANDFSITSSMLSEGFVFTIAVTENMQETPIGDINRTQLWLCTTGMPSIWHCN